MKNFTSKKIKRLLNTYKSIDLKKREGFFNANESDRFYIDAEFRAKTAKLEQITARMYKSYWRATNIDLRLSNQLFEAVQYLGNYDIYEILKTIYDFYKNKEFEELKELARDYFANNDENLDIIEEANNGDKSAIKMLIQEYQTQIKNDIQNKKMEVANDQN